MGRCAPWHPVARYRHCTPAVREGSAGFDAGRCGVVRMTARDFEAALKGRKVFVTGHTGFTGGWACLWLQSLGATVAGYSLPADTTPSLFAAAGIEAEMHSSTFGDICKYAPLLDAMREFEPELV